jgi:hypothetical protein
MPKIIITQNVDEANTLCEQGYYLRALKPLEDGWEFVLCKRAEKEQ